MANLFKTNGIDTERVHITFSPELAQLMVELDAWDEWQKVVAQIDKMPQEIAKLDYKGAAVYDVANVGERIQTVRDLKAEQTQLGSFRIHVAYEPGNSYRMGNSVGKVFATNAGLILLNDVRLKQVAGDPPNAIYLINLILHEVLHVYGIDHASTFGLLIKNRPVMNIGKFGFVGMSFDDRMGLAEYYNIRKGKRKTLTINVTSGRDVLIINRDKKRFSQGKWVKDNKAVFPYTKPGRYAVYVDQVKIRNVKVGNKDKEITL